MKEANFEKAGQEKVNPVEEVVGVELVKVPTEFGLAFQTNEGVLDMNSYLVWLGKKILSIEKAISYMLKA